MKDVPNYKERGILYKQLEKDIPLVEIVLLTLIFHLYSYTLLLLYYFRTSSTKAAHYISPSLDFGLVQSIFPYPLI